MYETRGRARLVQCLRPHGRRTQGWLAAQLGVDQSTVSLWVTGHTRPESALLRKALWILFRIPQLWWLTDDELKFLERVQTVAITERSGASASA